jgi:hypothetical protein
MDNAVEFLSRALSPDEREAVLGDLAESGDRGARALRGVLGLVVRRQAALWQDWRPWLGLFGLAWPLGWLLSWNAMSLDHASDLYLWIARNHSTIDPRTLAGTGLGLRHGMLQLMAASLLLVLRSWIAGVVLGSLSRRVMWVNRTAFCLTLACVVLAEVSRTGPYLYSVTGWVFPPAFYTAILPCQLLAALVLMPSLRGIARGRSLAVPDWRIAILWTVSVVVLAAATHAQLGLRTLSGYWPVGYLVAMSVSKENLRYEKTIR